jgi:hypothetical protein
MKRFLVADGRDLHVNDTHVDSGGVHGVLSDLIEKRVNEYSQRISSSTDPVFSSYYASKLTTLKNIARCLRNERPDIGEEWVLFLEDEEILVVDFEKNPELYTPLTSIGLRDDLEDQPENVSDGSKLEVFSQPSVEDMFRSVLSLFENILK